MIFAPYDPFSNLAKDHAASTCPILYLKTMTDFLNYLAQVQRFGIRPGLERIRALLETLPNRLVYPTILVGGTNGKGSTAQFLAILLAGQNRRIGLYTSPHLYDWNERLRIIEAENSATQIFSGAISDDDLENLFQDSLPYLNTVEAQHGQPTEFETLTFLALWHFARQNVDAASIEVGLGGRWDATNAIEPSISVITHVALDHCDRLGDTLELIAADKICIARPNRIVITGETKPQVLAVFREHCDKIGARLWPFRAIEFSNDLANCKEIWDEVSRLPLPDAPEFQRQNLQTARMADTAFRQEIGWPIEDESGAQWQVLAGVPGRFETINRAPEIIVDGANNPDGAQQLLQVLAERRDDWQRVILVIGISADKDYQTMLQVLAPHADLLIATQAQHPRALDAQVLAEHARKYLQGNARLEIVPEVVNAIERARQIADAKDLILVTGSFFVLGEVPR